MKHVTVSPSEDPEATSAVRCRKDLEAYLDGRAQAEKALRESLAAFHANAEALRQPVQVPPPAAPARQVIRPKQQGWSREQAASLLPPGAMIVKDPIAHRWRVEAPYMTTGKSRAWGPVTKVSDYRAMLFVLGCSWAAFERSGGHACPWDHE